MSTPIEIVRRYVAWRQTAPNTPQPCPFPALTALASVLRDAERFKALERFMDRQASGFPCIETGYNEVTGTYLGAQCEDCKYVTGSTLSELADRLRNQNDNHRTNQRPT